MQADANAIMTYQRCRLQDKLARTMKDCVGGAAENSQADADDMTFSQQVEAEMQDMELPLPKRCKVQSQGSADDILKILHVDETSLLRDAFSDLPESEEGSILREIEDVRATVAQHSQSSVWPQSLQHVVQGAICVHRLRLLDISRREEVFFLELIEGSSRHVRAHGGQCFFLSEHGHWAVYNGVVPQGVLARCKKFLRFVADGGLGSACVFRTEWRIYATDESVAGSIDFVAREPNGSLVLFDWKRARKLHEKDNSFGKFMKSPVSHVPDAALFQYRLQLNLYKWILERYYSICMWQQCMLCLCTLTIARMLTTFQTCKRTPMLL